MNRLSKQERAKILHLLCEGSSIRAVTRLTGASKTTVTKLLVDAGKACSDFQDQALRDLSCKRVQVDEIWSFVGAKAANADPKKKAAGKQGDVWTWTAIDADTKLVLSWLVGGRDSNAGSVFLHDLKSRLATRVQLTSDGHGSYLQAVPHAFDDNVDYAMLVKIYGPTPEGERRYSPPACLGARAKKNYRKS